MSNIVIEEPKLKAGDVVRHVCGGPRMTVENATGLKDLQRFIGLNLIPPDADKYKDIICVWFDKNDSFHKMKFSVDDLEKVENS